MAVSTPTDWFSQLGQYMAAEKPVAIVLAGHNGSGKSTFWYDRLANHLQLPLINADRLTLSLLPPAEDNTKLPAWARRLRDQDESWQKLSQAGVKRFMDLVVEHRMSFAFETVFSFLQKDRNGIVTGSKVDDIQKLQNNGYSVVLLFVGLQSADVSIARVQTRKDQGGHDVPIEKLQSRFPRTQEAIRRASAVADLTLMFDNSRSNEEAFSLARVQSRDTVIYDCRRDNAPKAHRPRRPGANGRGTRPSCRAVTSPLCAVP
jgi:predicted ABC-type ATPase